MKHPIFISPTVLAAAAVLTVCFVAFEAGRLTARYLDSLDASCPFDFEDMDITPKTPAAYHHITGHRAVKHGVAVPLPPRRPTI